MLFVVLRCGLHLCVMSHRIFWPWNANTVTSRPTCNSLEALPGVLGNILFQLNRGEKAEFLGKQGNGDNIGKTNFQRSPSGGGGILICASLL